MGVPPLCPATSEWARHEVRRDGLISFRRTPFREGAGLVSSRVAWFLLSRAVPGHGPGGGTVCDSSEGQGLQVAASCRRADRLTPAPHEPGGRMEKAKGSSDRAHCGMTGRLSSRSRFFLKRYSLLGAEATSDVGSGSELARELQGGPRRRPSFSIRGARGTGSSPVGSVSSRCCERGLHMCRRPGGGVGTAGRAPPRRTSLPRAAHRRAMAARKKCLLSQRSWPINRTDRYNALGSDETAVPCGRVGGLGASARAWNPWSHHDERLVNPFPRPVL